ncbi:MAG TPA: ABC transporter ATP-binding protein [Candidatus Didemnitutus sp.]|nr:ABC transporter ATP-binding protein [Candidatus Didemnitutus sp.]
MTPPAPASLRVQALTKRYGGVVGIDRVSFSVAPGEVFGLLGPNGAGKTTALECVCGLRAPDAGAVEIAGRDATRQPRDVRRVLGVQLQHATLPSQIRPREAIDFFASFHRAPRPTDELLANFGLAALAARPFGALSGGERQRLFLALALVNDPSLVILDEPTAGLDPSARRELQDLIHSLRAGGRAVVLTTHDLDEAARLCDRIAILDHGRVVAAGAPADIVNASGLPARVRVRLRRESDHAKMHGLQGLTPIARAGNELRFETTDLAGALAELSRLIAAREIEVVEIQTGPATLEDAFLRLTGRAWSPDDGERREGS